MPAPSKRQYLIEKLRDDIRTGKYRIGERFPSEYELADIYNINRITVNKAVNILVNEGYLERAGSNRGGTRVRRNRLYPEGILGYISTLRDGFTSSIAINAARTAAKHGYILSLASPGTNEIGDTLRNIEAAQMKGVLSVHYGKLNTSLPVVYIDGEGLNTDGNEDMVLCDNYAGGRMIAEYVLKAGHRNIVYLSKPHSISYTDFRRKGVVAAMQDYGIADAEARCFMCSGGTLHHCTQTLHEISREFPDVSAILCNTDYVAFDVIKAVRQKMVEISDRITVTGFGNIRAIQELVSFPSIEQHPEVLGLKACERLIEIIENKPDEHEKLQRIGVELIVPGTESRSL